MTATLRMKKVDRQDLYKKIAEKIKQSPLKQAEISASDLADEFGVEPPTMDHHLKKLVSEGMLLVSPRRGRYNRKIYLLPENKENVVTHLQTGLSDQSAARRWLEERRRMAAAAAGKPLDDTKSEQQNANLDQDIKAPVQDVKPEERAESPGKAEPLEVKELTLDERIQDFLARSSSVPSAESVLQKSDRDILAVVTESIQQHMIYLRDLTEQLSTVQDKTLILGLIEERNQNLERIRQLEEEVKGYINTISQLQKQPTEQKNKLDPQRVRYMHQVIINTVDSFVELPNHAMALKRGEFRKQIAEEISNLVKYVLQIDN